MTEEPPKEEQPAVKSRGMIIVAVSVICIIALFVLLLRPVSEKPKTMNYNGFEFVNFEGIWRTDWQMEGQAYELDFRFNPKEVENIPVTGKTDARFQFERVYLTFDPTSDERTKETAYINLAAVELSRKLVEPFERNVTAACTRNETDACASRPVITCENTNSSVIYLRQAKEAKIILNGNCAVIQGNGEDIVRAVDKTLFQWLKIMN